MAEVVGILDLTRNWRWRLAGHGRPLDAAFPESLRGARVLEMGGPSAVFRASNLLPIYPVASAVDGLQWAAETEWHGHQAGGVYAPDGAPTGRLLVTDDPDLAGLPAGAYEGVISSHVIEHLANPLRALAAWRRVTTPGGVLLTVAPHMEGTFDRRRPVTPLQHLVADFENATGEDDLTHLEETLELHDHRLDVDARTEEWEAKRKSNAQHRVLHHHVFTTVSLLDVLAHAGLACSAVTVRWPHDIYVLGRWPSSSRVNTVSSTWLEHRAAALRSSPFQVDRLAAARESPKPSRDPSGEVDAMASAATRRSSRAGRRHADDR